MNELSRPLTRDELEQVRESFEKVHKGYDITIEDGGFIEGWLNGLPVFRFGPARGPITIDKFDPLTVMGEMRLSKVAEANIRRPS